MDPGFFHVEEYEIFVEPVDVPDVGFLSLFEVLLLFEELFDCGLVLLDGLFECGGGVVVVLDLFSGSGYGVHHGYLFLD